MKDPEGSLHITWSLTRHKLICMSKYAFPESVSVPTLAFCHKFCAK